MKRNYLKSILVLALSATLTLTAFTGCGSSSGSGSKSSSELTASDLNKDPKDYKGTINYVVIY